MTTGNIVRSGTPAAGGLGSIGIIQKTTWSGIDTPRLSSPKPPRVFYETTRLETRIKKSGKNKGKKYTVTVPYRFSVRPPNPAGPVRKHMPENNFTKVIRLERSPGVQFAQEYYSNRLAGAGYVSFSIHGNPPTAPLLTSNDQNRLVSKLWDKVKGSGFDASIFLGESHKSIQMVADSAIRIAKSIYHIRKGDAKGAARSLLEGTSRAPLARRFDALHGAHAYPNLASDSRGQAALWLQLQYGWKPLLSDTKAAAEMLAQQLEFPLRKVVRARVAAPAVNKLLRKTVYEGTFVTPVKESHERFIKAVFAEDFNPSTMAKLGLLDPENVAWELIPFSFVADWFIPIGSFLEARSSVARLGPGTYVTSDIRKSWRGSSSLTAPRLNPPSIPSFSYDFDYVAMSRTVTNSPLTHAPQFKPLSEALTIGHLANALALVTQVFTKPVKALGTSIQSTRSRHTGLFGPNSNLFQN